MGGRTFKARPRWLAAEKVPPKAYLRLSVSSWLPRVPPVPFHAVLSYPGATHHAATRQGP